MSGIFGIGITGLRAAQIGLTTAGHNISNASTAGFHRQEIVQTTTVPLYTGSGFVGQGTNVETVRRIYSQFLENQLQSAQTQSNYLETYSAQIDQIDNMLADPAAGLSPALQEFFAGVHDVSANPSSVPARQNMLSGAEAMVTRFQTLNQRFEEIRDGVDSQITSSIGIINSYAQQIAELNRRVVLAEASGNGQPPNDILDQRDQLVSEINKEINVSVVKQSDGSYNIFMGKGQALVVGQQAYTLAAAAPPEDSERLDVGYVTNNTVLFLPQDSLDGGNLGGLLAFRSQTLDTAQNALGRVAIGLAQTLNEQHRLGQDLNGALGGYLFNVRGVTGLSGQNAIPSAKVVANANNSVATALGVPAVTLTNVGNLTTSDYTLSYSAAGYSLTRLSDKAVLFANAALPQTIDGMTIAAPATAPAAGDNWLIEPTRDGARDIAVAISDTSKIAAAAPIRTNATISNTGTGKITAGVVNPPPPTNADLQQAVTITFHTPYDGQFDVTGTGVGLPANNQVFTEGANISFNGWTVQINGAPAAGDTFTIGPNTNGVSDNRNALLLAGLQTKNTLAGNSATYQGAYSQLVSSVGVKARDIHVTAQAQASLVSQSQQAQQSMSGVNLDEEAANLLRYQQAYQASGKMMQIASTLFDTLLSLGQ